MNQLRNLEVYLAERVMLVQDFTTSWGRTVSGALDERRVVISTEDGLAKVYLPRGSDFRRDPAPLAEELRRLCGITDASDTIHLVKVITRDDLEAVKREMDRDGVPGYELDVEGVLELREEATGYNTHWKALDATCPGGPFLDSVPEDGDGGGGGKGGEATINHGLFPYRHPEIQRCAIPPPRRPRAASKRAWGRAVMTMNMGVPNVSDGLDHEDYQAFAEYHVGRPDCGAHARTPRKLEDKRGQRC